MKRPTSQEWETLRTLTAITAAIGAMICLLILAGCTNELTGQDENRGNGQALTLGTVSIEGGNTRAANAVPDVASGHSFRDGEELHVTLTAGGAPSAGSAQSTGTYRYNGNSSWSSTKTECAYWQGSGSHTLTAWWGPAYSSSSPAVYNMPSDYETNNATAGGILNAWDDKQYTFAADKWHITDLLHYSGIHSATLSSIDLVLEHSMAQLCVNLLPGDGITAEQLQKATVHLKQAKAYFTMSADGRPVIHNHGDGETSTHPDVRLLKNGSASLAYYALMLPGQTFAANRLMISIHIGNDIYKYLPTNDITTQANTCHELNLKVNKAGVSALSVTSTGWQSPTLVEATQTGNFVTVENETAGSLLADGSALKTALASAGQSNPIRVVIMGKINDQDLVDLEKQMEADGYYVKYFKVSHLYITASGATAIPEGFCSPGKNTNTTLQEVILPEGITSIGQKAFIGCQKLTSIQLPETVKEIGNQAFSQCNILTKINIPEGVTKIGESTFSMCTSLTSIQLPEGLTEVGRIAFANCSSLKEISIPKEVTKIEAGTFQGCTSLTSIQLPEGLTEIGSNAFMGCRSLKGINIPKEVTKIGESTFGYCWSLTSIQLPEGLTEIGSNAFYSCNSLTTINIPKGVTKIGVSTFEFCTSLPSIQLPETVTEIGGSAFNYCSSLKEINIPKVTSIGNYAFAYCSSLTEISIPKAVTSIGKYAFNYCSTLKEVVLSGTNDQDGFSLPTVGDGAFADTAATLLFLTDVTDDMFEAEGNAAKYKSWGGVTWQAIHYNLTVDNPASLTNPENYSGHWPKDSPQ